MRILLCNSPPSLTPLSPTPPQKPPLFPPNAAVWAKKTLVTALTGALSITLLVSFPYPSLSRDSPSFQPPRPPQFSNPLPDRCTEEEEQQEQEEDKVELKPQFVTNEEIVQEAWQIVNDSFLDTGRHWWSPQSWQVIDLYFIYFRLIFSLFSVFLLIWFSLCSKKRRIFWGPRFKRGLRLTS